MHLTASVRENRVDKPLDVKLVIKDFFIKKEIYDF